MITIQKVAKRWGANRVEKYEYGEDVFVVMFGAQEHRVAINTRGASRCSCGPKDCNGRALLRLIVQKFDYATDDQYTVDGPPLSPTHFSLEEIAHFDRCLLPGDFELDLINIGVERYQASGLAGFVARHPDGGIVRVFQEYITDTQLGRKLEQLVSHFVLRFRKEPSA